MTQDTKTLLPWQEAEIARQLATASRLEFPAFCRAALKHPFFPGWFRRRYVTELFLEKITPDMREPFMVAWEAKLRAEYAADNERAEQDVLDALPDDDTAAEPIDALPMTRSGAVQHAREHDDDDSRRDDGDSDDDDGPLTADAPSIAVADYAPPNAPERPTDPDSPRVILLGEWCSKFRALPYAMQKAWEQTHVKTIEWAGAFLDAVYLEPIDGAIIPDTFTDFAAFSETVRRFITRADNQFASASLDDIEDTETLYTVPGMIPANALTAIYGTPKAGKSALAHKIAVCVADPSLEFDGLPVAHGPVLFITADPGARARSVKPRFLQIMERLGVKPNDNIRVVDSPVILNDPASVDALLKANPGDFALVVIDPLYRCANGDLAQASVMVPVIGGLMRIAAATGAAVVVLHHEGRGGPHLFGSVFLDAALDSQVHVVRDDDRVTVKVELLKNDNAPERPFVYQLDGAFLDAGEADARGATSKRPDILAALPTTATPRGDVRKLIEHMLVGKTRKSRDGEWGRLCKTWEAAGLVVVKGNTIRRV